MDDFSNSQMKGQKGQCPDAGEEKTGRQEKLDEIGRVGFEEQAILKQGKRQHNPD
jgi:hypothetical protein